MFGPVSGLMFGSYVVVYVSCGGILIWYGNHHLEDK